MPPAKQRTAQLRDQVLASAVELLAAVGAKGFTARNVADRAQTSTPAVYELFGDKGGLLREVYFAGFRLLHETFVSGDQPADPTAALFGLAASYRTFARDNPALVELMFARPFTEFTPGPDDLAALASVRGLVVDAVQRCLDSGAMVGDAVDIAQVFVVTIQGLAAAENAQRLGSPASADRRWDLALTTLRTGLRPDTHARTS